MSTSYEAIASEERRPRPATRVIVIAALVAFVLGLLVMGYAMRHYDRWFRQSVPTTQPAAKPAAPVAKPTAAPAEPDDPVALAARESALSARLAQLEARTATVDSEARYASGYATRAEGLMVAFAARRALDRGLGLGYVEGQLRDRFGQSQPRAVAVVVQAARQPVTLEDLRQGLDTLAPDLVTGTVADGWIAGLKRELSNMIVIRREGTPSPRPTDRLARARRALEGGQVEAALAEVARLPGAPQATAWMQAARRYIAARRALDVIETAAVLGQGEPAQPPALPANGVGQGGSV